MCVVFPGVDVNPYMCVVFPVLTSTLTCVLYFQVVTAINRITLAADGSGTNIGDALNLARTEVFRSGRGDRQDSPNVVIIITGTDNHIVIIIMTGM